MGKLRQKQPRLVLNHEEYDQLKERVLNRDGWKCQSCGTSANLQVHHLVRRSQLEPDALETKYTPGAVDYERIILGEWNVNIGEIGTESGGTGTRKNLRLIGLGLLIDSAKAPAGQHCTLRVDDTGLVSNTGCACLDYKKSFFKSDLKGLPQISL